MGLLTRTRHPTRWPWLRSLGYDREKLARFRWYGRGFMLVCFVVAALAFRSAESFAANALDDDNANTGKQNTRAGAADCLIRLMDASSRIRGHERA